MSLSENYTFLPSVFILNVIWKSFDDVNVIVLFGFDLQNRPLSESFLFTPNSYYF